MLLYYVYIHYYIENGNKIIIYVGKGSNGRAYDFTGRNEIWKEYRDKYGNPNVEIVKTFTIEKEAYRYENKLRNIYYAKGQSICSLDWKRTGTNSYWHKNGIRPEMKEKIRNTLTGRKSSKETKEKISRKTKGKNNPNYGNGKKISGSKHAGSKKCAVVDNEGKIEATFTNVIFMVEYVKEKYNYTGAKNCLLKNKEVTSRYKKHDNIRGYTFIYLD